MKTVHNVVTFIMVALCLCSSVSGVNETFTATTTTAFLYSPGFESNINYKNNLVYDYLVQTTTTGHVVQLHVENCHIEFHDDGTCQYDKLSIYDGSSDAVSLLSVFCCANNTLPTFSSSGQSAYLKFETDDRTAYEGFNISFRSYDKSEIPGVDTIDCGNLNIPNGAANGETFHGGSGLSVTCGAGYTAVGTTPIECLSSGSWKIAVTCNADCSSLNIADGTTTGYTHYGGGGVTVTCYDGYSLEGSNPVMCSPGGTWQNVPACTYDAGQNNVGIIVGCVFGILALIVIVGLVIYCCFIKQKGPSTPERVVSQALRSRKNATSIHPFAVRPSHRMTRETVTQTMVDLPKNGRLPPLSNPSTPKHTKTNTQTNNQHPQTVAPSNSLNGHTQPRQITNPPITASHHFQQIANPPITMNNQAQQITNPQITLNNNHPQQINTHSHMIYNQPHQPSHVVHTQTPLINNQPSATDNQPQPSATFTRQSLQTVSRPTPEVLVEPTEFDEPEIEY